MKNIVYIFSIFLSLCANGQTLLTTEINTVKTNLNMDSAEALDASLEKLINRVGTKRIVALGEDTHGTKEYFQLRNAITQKLIEEKGFNLIILENPYDDLEYLTKNLQTSSPDSLLQKHTFAIYQTAEMKKMLQWLRQYNQTHQPIRFVGCDDSYSELLIEMLAENLKPYNTPELESLISKLYEYERLSFTEYYEKYPEEKPAGRISHYSYNREVYRLYLKIEKILEKQHAMTPKLEELLMNAKNSYINFKLIFEKNIKTRDIVMAERVAYYAKNPNAKIIVWAHNAHISKEVIIDNEIGLMGRNLYKEFPNEYVAVAMSSARGEYSFMKKRLINDDHDYKDQLYTGTSPALPQNSWEQKLASVASPAYYFPVTETIKKYCLENEAQKIKLFGYSQASEKDYYKINPAILYDEIIFIRKTQHTTPLFTYETSKG